ncbi:hypothetical protein H9Q69_007052 [Fusarium xylarioides]|nr:hypothetical protein H9Q70_007498 [Fusarium xylarioides]KAG5793890.1 hypothetical protein H9Q69_007052 [Fusarium xylarioides]
MTMKTTSRGRPHSTLLEVTGAVPTVLSGRNIEFMLLSERGSQPASHVDDFAPGIFFTCYQGHVEIIPPNPNNIGADLPEEDERLDVHEMIEISVIFRECGLQLFDEARVLQFWTELGGRMRACRMWIELLKTISTQKQSRTLTPIQAQWSYTSQQAHICRPDDDADVRPPLASLPVLEASF